MHDTVYVIGVFVAMALVTFALRALPFVLGKRLMEYRWVADLGSFLPLAIMVILVAHSVTGAAASHDGLPVPEILAVLVTVLLQWFLKNALFSIFAGTAAYMLLLNGFVPFLYS